MTTYGVYEGQTLLTTFEAETFIDAIDIWDDMSPTFNAYRDIRVKAIDKEETPEDTTEETPDLGPLVEGLHLVRDNDDHDMVVAILSDHDVDSLNWRETFAEKGRKNVYLDGVDDNVNYNYNHIKGLTYYISPDAWRYWIVEDEAEGMFAVADFTTAGMRDTLLIWGYEDADVIGETTEDEVDRLGLDVF